MWHWKEFLEKGKKVEYEFSSLLSKYGSIEPATVDEDIKDHIDLWLVSTKTGQRVSYDVKSIKAVKRGAGLDDTKHHIELRSVISKGTDDGWLYGKANYIVFETNKTFIIVDRKRLIDFMDPHINKLRYSFEPDLYCKYKRKDYKDEKGILHRRNDETMLVETSELVKISTLIINKN
jgi:hypothetical protein